MWSGGWVRRLAGGGLATVVAVAIAGLVTACSQTSRVDLETTSDKLAQSGKAVAIMRIGMASPNCKHVGLWLGVREGLGFRPVKPVSVIHATSLADVPIAEVELDPGEYHVISYACGTGETVKQVAAWDQTTGLVRTSLASFRIAAGEVVNVGSFEFHASRVGLNAFGRPIRTTVSVTDWPLGEIERYKERRPQIFAQMRTRLMTVTPRGTGPDEDDCAALRRLQADGKVQGLPAACTTAEPAKAAAKAR